MSWGMVAAAAASVIGGAMSADSASKDRSLQKKAAKKLSNVAFDPKSISGPGGLGVTFGEEGTSFDLGDFQSIFDLFGDNANRSLVQGQELQEASSEFLPGIFQGIGNAQTISQESFDRFGDLQFDGFQRGLQDQLFGGAGSTLGRLGGGFDDIRGSTLDLLRRQAQPFEERAFGNLQENQFATGQLGSSGGGLQTEAFARGLGQADLSRQLAAGDEARNVQNSFQQLLAQQLGGGQALRGQESDLLQQAFGQFAGSQGLASQLQQSVFNQGGALTNQAGQQLGGQQSLLGMLMSLGGFAGDLEASRADTDIRAKGGAAGALGNLGASGNDMIAGFLGSLGSNLADQDFFQGGGSGGATTNSGLNTSSLGGVGSGDFNPFADMFGGGG